MTKATVLAAFLMFSVAQGANAEARLKKWVDEKGEVHYGDVVPPEYANKDRVLLDKKGRQVKSPEEEEGASMAEKKAALEQRRKDHALLNTYSNEKEIDLARDRNLQQVEARIEGIKMLQKSAQESLAGFHQEEADLRQAGKPAPASLKADIKASEEKIAKLKQDLETANEKAASVRAAYEADKMRYRELTGGSRP